MYYNFQVRKQILLEKKRKRLVIFTIISIIILYLSLTIVFDENGLLRYISLKEEKVRLLSEVKKLKYKNELLKEEIRLLKSEPFYIEKMAREELNLSRPNEYIFLFETTK